MIGWIVENTSRSGWRQKCRRFRIGHDGVVDRGSTRRLAVRLRVGRQSRRACSTGIAATAAVPCGLPFSLGAWPVSCRKTSSSVGPRRPISLTPIPARRSSAAASSTRTRLSRGAGIVSRSGRPSCSGWPQPTRSSAALGLVTLLHVGQLDLEDLTADAILQLVAGPFRDHAAVIDDSDLVRELIRFFEVLRRQQNRRPLAAQVADDVPDLVATSRIETRGRLVEEEHTRLREHAGREVEPPPHTARICLRGSVGGVRELEALEQLRRAAACLRAREPEQAPEHLEVLAARQQLVDRRELTRQGQLLSHLRRVGDNVETEQLRLAPRQAEARSRGCERGWSCRRRSGRGGRRPFLPAPPGRRRPGPSSNRTASPHL